MTIEPHEMTDTLSDARLEEMLAYLKRMPDGGNRHWGSEYSRKIGRDAVAALTELRTLRAASNSGVVVTDYAEKPVNFAGWKDQLLRIQSLLPDDDLARQESVLAIVEEMLEGFDDVIETQALTAEPQAVEPVATEHDPRLVDALRRIKKKLEALPEPMRGPFIVEGLAPYAHPQPAAVPDGWRPIKSYTGDCGTVLFGHWYEDDCSGYNGESRWLWIASGCCDSDWWFCDFSDNQFNPKYFHTVTHWMPMLPSPLSNELGK